MKLYNSISKKLEEFTPIKEGVVSMYVCGPTVYGLAHIGNARPPLVFDYLHRCFLFFGYDVKYFSNITDIDDKIIVKALNEGVSEKVITEKFTNIYNEDMKSLNIFPLSGQPKVVESMDKIIDFISQLLTLDFAYTSDDKTIYFNTDKVKEYERFVGQNLDQLNVGTRIAKEVGKRGDFDFVLWKPTSEGVKFDAPFGSGRPGWHTECVVMIQENFGQKIDIHGGGQDLRFPHHSNEMAQSQAVCGHGLANVWMHSGMINFGEEKMSKSKGNIITIQDFRKNYSSDAIRFWMYSANYRQTIMYSEEILDSAKKSILRLQMTFDEALLTLGLKIHMMRATENLENLDEYRLKLITLLGHDLSMPNVLSLLQDVAKELKGEYLYEALCLFKTIGFICGFQFTEKNITDEVTALVHLRKEARIHKDFIQADKIKEELLQLGWVVR